ncbi:MAG: hypothetical protein AAFX02_07840 [Pseudomonadota bacterium]
MSLDPNTAREDLAFMRALVDETGSNDRSTGIVYGAAGLLYGIQCLLNWALLAGNINASQLVWLAIGILPTAIFLIINVSYVWSNRSAPFGNGAAQRALQAVFAGGGIANAIMALLFGWVAFQKQDWSIWFLFPVVVAAFQGAIWFAAMIIRKRAWYGWTAVGWFVSTIVLGLLIDQTNTYILALGIVMILCMGVPGYVMIRNANAESD